MVDHTGEIERSDHASGSGINIDHDHLNVFSDEQHAATEALQQVPQDIVQESRAKGKTVIRCSGRGVIGSNAKFTRESRSSSQLHF